MHFEDNNRIKKISRISLMLSDIVSVLAPAWIIYTFSDKIGAEEHFRTKTLLGIILFAISILFWSQTLFQQYTIRRSFYDEFKELLQIFLFNGLAALSSLFVFELSNERLKHVVFLCSVFIAIPILRFLTRLVLDKANLWRIDCLLFCPQSEFKFAKTAIDSQFNLGMKVRGFGLENRLLIKLINQENSALMANYAQLKKQILSYHESIGSPHIIILSHRKNSNHVPKIVELLILTGLPYSIIPDVGGVSLLGMRVSHFFRWEVMLITPQNNIDRLSYQILKRSFDVFFSIALLILLAIPMVLIYFLVKQDGGPGIFRHKRVGKNGVAFYCLKYRSMKPDADNILQSFLMNNPVARREWEENHKIINDPRVTRVGKFLRSLSLDELPQLLNVIKGEMSLVGPRPIVESELSKYEKNIEMYYSVRPGLTGLWQISGRSNTSYNYRIALDIWYIKNWSLWYDIAIIVKTIAVVLKKTGAH